MSDTFKFPNGTNVKVVRKQEILDCIYENILDKDVALAVIKELEVEATSKLLSGYSVNIPHIGSIRKSIHQQLKEEDKEILDSAKSSLSKEKFILFKQQYRIQKATHKKYDKYFKYIVSRNVNKYKRFFKYKKDQVKNKYLVYLIMFSFDNLTYEDIIYNGEDRFID